MVSHKEARLVLCGSRQLERIERMHNKNASSKRQSLGAILARSLSGRLEAIVMRERLRDIEAP